MNYLTPQQGLFIHARLLETFTLQVATEHPPPPYLAHWLNEHAQPDEPLVP